MKNIQIGKIYSNGKKIEGAVINRHYKERIVININENIIYYHEVLLYTVASEDGVFRYERKGSCKLNSFTRWAIEEIEESKLDFLI